MRTHATYKSKRGFALVIVLSIVAFLSLIGYTMVFSVRVHARIADNSIRQAQARYLARAAVEKSMAILLDSEIAEESGLQIWQDSAQYEPQELGPGTFEVAYSDSSSETGVVYGLEDEAGKLNLNIATREQLLLLPNMTDALADCLIDWRDEDETPSTFGAESETYLSLDQPYMAKNRTLGSLRELLLVQGYEPTVLYGEDHNKNGLLDPNEDDGEDSEPPDDEDGILDEGILRYITVCSADENVQADGSARVNIQKASAEELMRGMQGLTREQADAIVAYRGQSEFKGIADLLNVTRPADEKGQGEEQPEDAPEDSSGQEGQGREGNTQGAERDSRGGQQQVDGRQQQGGRNESPQSDGGGERQQRNPYSGTGAGGTRSFGRRSGNDGTANASGDKMFTMQELSRWIDAITVSDEEMIPGLINLNTASDAVLATIEELEEDDIAQILLMRGAETSPFKSLADLINLPSMTEEKLKSVIDKFTTRTNQFTVRAAGMVPSAKARQQIEAVIERKNGTASLLYWREG